MLGGLFQFHSAIRRIVTRPSRADFLRTIFSFTSSRRCALRGIKKSALQWGRAGHFTDQESVAG